MVFNGQLVGKQKRLYTQRAAFLRKHSAMIAPMRRWLAILFLVLLPVQATWAAAASYCRHGGDETTQHFGHHEHQHQADQHAEASTTPDTGTDNDCPVCHAGCVAALTGSTAVVEASLSMTDQANLLLTSATAPTTLPERPNWSLSA